MSPLSPEMLAALRDAQALPLSYGVRVYEAPGGATLVVLGESHLELGFRRVEL